MARKKDTEHNDLEGWNVKILQLFKRTSERKAQEAQEREQYIKYITTYTDSNGVRETARRLTDAGFKVDPTRLSEIRKDSENYDVDYIAGIAKKIAELEKK